MIRTEPAPVASVDDLEKASVRELEATHAEGIALGERPDVDGETAVHVSSQFSLNNLEYRVEQFTVIHGGAVYFVTFSYGHLDLDVATPPGALQVIYRFVLGAAPSAPTVGP